MPRGDGGRNCDGESQPAGVERPEGGDASRGPRSRRGRCVWPAKVKADAIIARFKEVSGGGGGATGVGVNDIGAISESPRGGLGLPGASTTTHMERLKHAKELGYLPRSPFDGDQVRVPPVVRLLDRSTCPGRATSVTRGAALSAASASNSRRVTADAVSAVPKPATTQRGWNPARRRGGVQVDRPVRAPPRRTQPARSRADPAHHGVDESRRPLADGRAHQVDARGDRRVVGHAHREQLVRASRSTSRTSGWRRGLVRHASITASYRPCIADRPGRSSVASAASRPSRPCLRRTCGQHEVGVGVLGRAPRRSTSRPPRRARSTGRSGAQLIRGAPAPASSAPWPPTRR